MSAAVDRSPLIAAGLLMGAGLGGFVDGIVFHQILQWHNMLSAKIPPNDLVSAKANMTWDGLFHAGVWMLTVAGLWMLWRAGGRRAAGAVVVARAGGRLAGAGERRAVVAGGFGQAVASGVG